jgi:hypothetical protein
MTVTLLSNDLRSHILRGSTKSVSSIPFVQLLYKPEVSQLYKTIRSKQDVLWLQVTEDVIFAMQILEAEDHLSCVEFCH